MVSGDSQITLTRTSGGSLASAQVVIPSALGAVRLGREIGRGGMGVVYLGRDTVLDRDVAVKFLLNAVTGEDDPGFARFLEGARAAAAVRHASLNTIHAADVVEGVPYLVMEYIDGPSLSAVLRHSGAMGVATCAAVLEDAASGVGALHARGIVHCDIKPANIMLSVEGQVVVTDFGLAVARRSAQRSRAAGTPAYMAPETTDGVVSERSDVYSLGITLYELLTGRLPFGGMLDEVRSQHAATPLPAAPLDDRGIESCVREILERSTHKNPMFRYKTAEHFLRALSDAVSRDAVAAAAGELPSLIASCLGASPARDEGVSDASGSSSYSDRIAELAASKRGERPSAADERRQSAPVHDATSPDTLVVDITCVRCDYNLRGLREGAKCPECGIAIALSLKHDRLIFADPVWFSRFVRGNRITRIATAVILFVIVAPLLVTPFLISSAMFSEGAGGLDFSIKLLKWAAIAVTVVVAVVVFHTTAREPGGASTKLAELSRLLPRVMVVVAAAALAMAPWLRSGVTRSVLVTAIVAGCLSYVAYLAWLVERIPDRRVTRARRLWFVLIAATPTFIGASIVLSDWSPNATAAGRRLHEAFSLTGAVLLATALVTTPWLMLRCFRLLKKAGGQLVARDAMFAGSGACNRTESTVPRSGR